MHSDSDDEKQKAEWSSQQKGPREDMCYGVE